MQIGDLSCNCSHADEVDFREIYFKSKVLQFYFSFVLYQRKDLLLFNKSEPTRQ